MKPWTALVPLKIGLSSKSRLGDVLRPEQRIALIEHMARIVLGALTAVPQIERIVVLSAELPRWWRGEWAQDRESSLNAALETWRNAEQPDRLLVIHGDLPFVRPEEVMTLLEAAEQFGAALATDQLEQGTNALALANGTRLPFHFGTDSREKHAAAMACAILRLAGLARDIDSPADLAALQDQIGATNPLSQYSR